MTSCSSHDQPECRRRLINQPSHGDGILRVQRPAAQPRRVKVPARAHGASGAPARRKAEPGNAAHVGQRCRAVISRVFVAAGQTVNAGDVLVSIEAMKMETAIHAEKDGAVAKVLVKAGDQIDPKDLLVVYKQEKA